MRKYIDSIFTDVASLIIGDPCKLLYDKRKSLFDLKYTYYNFLNRSILEEDAIIVNTNCCDGWCNVYAEYDENGDMTEVTIDLNPRVKPGE